MVRVSRAQLSAQLARLREATRLAPHSARESANRDTTWWYALAHRPLPRPPETWRRGPLRRDAFSSPARSPRLTSLLGTGLGVAFGLCLVTGLVSHAIQHPPEWFWWPAAPVWLYRVTQGLHVATGLAAIPLLSAKLWSVYPKLFSWPPVPDLASVLERGSILVLIAAAMFQLATGVLNITQWYSLMPFGFIAAHFWTAWLAVGALLVHIAVKLPIIRRGLSRQSVAEQPTPPAVTGARGGSGMSRRGALITVGAAMATVTLATVGQTVRPLSPVSVLAPRRPDVGPQGLPVNKTALAAGVTESARDPGYRLTVTGPAGQLRLSLADLATMTQYTAALPITCVEGWSATGHWTGVRVRDLLAMVGVAADEDVHATVTSLQRGAYGSSTLAPPHAHHPDTLLALRLNGQTLDLDHGYPVRLIAPNRPGAMQTKWVTTLTGVRG